MGSKQRQFLLLYWTGWQQVHKRLAKQTEVPPTVLPAGGSGVPHRRRIVICRCGKCQAGARSGFRPDCGQHLGACRERKRPARVGHHHGGPTRMCYQGHRCCCLPALGPGGTLACELNDCDDFYLGASESCRGGSWSYVLAISCMRHRCQVVRVQGSNSHSR